VQRLAFVVVALSLVACAHSGVVPTGPDSFMIAKSQWGFTSGSVHKARLLQEASEFCQRRGMQMVVTSTSQNDVAFGKTPAAEVHFRCVSAEDAEQEQSAPDSEKLPASIESHTANTGLPPNPSMQRTPPCRASIHRGTVGFTVSLRAAGVAKRRR